MYHYKKKFDNKNIIIVILIIGSLLLFLNSRKMKIIINQQQDEIFQLIELSDKTKKALTDSTKQINSLNIKIAQLEHDLKEK